MNRLVRINYTNDIDVEYLYDETVDVNGYDHGKGRGRLTTVLDGSGFSKYKYDARGNIVEHYVDFAGLSTFRTRYSYDDNGNLSEIIYPSGRVVTYEPSSNDPDRVARVLVAGAVIAEN